MWSDLTLNPHPPVWSGYYRNALPYHSCPKGSFSFLIEVNLSCITVPCQDYKKNAGFLGIVKLQYLFVLHDSQSCIIPCVLGSFHGPCSTLMHIECLR